MRIVAEPVGAKPTEIKLHQVSRFLEISFDDGKTFELPYEYLRVYTPSAEAVGHGPGQEVLQVGKEDVTIIEVKPVGNYGIAPKFSDGHDSGIYSWNFLYKLGNDYRSLWERYLRELEKAGHVRREPFKN
ncbi:MAG: gamma-butyrobetaine hydroxylase-like domain-containing protein [Gammaproteobacteria bacterium]